MCRTTCIAVKRVTTTLTEIGNLESPRIYCVHLLCSSVTNTGNRHKWSEVPQTPDAG